MQPRDHVGHRITVSGHTGILQGLPASGVTIYDEDAGGVLTVPALHEDIEDARLTCDKCLSLCNRRFTHPDRPDTNWCAECSRPFAQSHQIPAACERCGREAPAVRNPTRGAEDQRYMCRTCHADIGTNFAIPPSAMRSSDPLPGGQGRPQCAAAANVASTPCIGHVKPRPPTGENLCNAHAGTKRTGERKPSK